MENTFLLLDYEFLESQLITSKTQKGQIHVALCVYHLSQIRIFFSSWSHLPHTHCTHSSPVHCCWSSSNVEQQTQHTFQLLVVSSSSSHLRERAPVDKRKECLKPELYCSQKSLLNYHRINSSFHRIDRPLLTFLDLPWSSKYRRC